MITLLYLYCNMIIITFYVYMFFFFGYCLSPGPEVRQIHAFLVPQFPYNFHYHVILFSLYMYHCIVSEIGNKLYYILFYPGTTYHRTVGFILYVYLLSRSRVYFCPCRVLYLINDKWHGLNRQKMDIYFHNFGEKWKQNTKSKISKKNNTYKTKLWEQNYVNGNIYLHIHTMHILNNYNTTKMLEYMIFPQFPSFPQNSVHK